MPAQSMHYCTVSLILIFLVEEVSQSQRWSVRMFPKKNAILSMHSVPNINILGREVAHSAEMVFKDVSDKECHTEPAQCL